MTRMNFKPLIHMKVSEPLVDIDSMDMVVMRSSDIQTSHSEGAGLLLFCRHPSDGRILFAMARESVLKRSHCKSQYWSGFEGSSKALETEIETAAREFIEESLGVFRGLETYAKVENVLKKELYLCKIRLIAVNKTGGTSRYTTYLKEVDFDESAAKRFSQNRRCLRCIKTINSNMSRCDSVLAEYYHKNARFLNMHPSINIFKQNGEVCRIEINEEFMEKDTIEFWDVPRLSRLLRNHGKLDSNMIKPFFVPTMIVALHETHKC